MQNAFLNAFHGCSVTSELSGGRRPDSPFPMLTTSCQVFALLQLAMMQLAGDKAPAMAVDTVREMLAAHTDTAVVTALKLPIVEIAPVLHAFILLVHAY